MAPEVTARHAQREWLLEGPKQSRAVFKRQACGCGWSTAKGPGEDAWSAFLHERNLLFDVIPWSEHGDYDLHDLVSSPLAQRSNWSWLDRLSWRA